jgi:hypothetical protein
MQVMDQIPAANEAQTAGAKARLVIIVPSKKQPRTENDSLPGIG